MRKYACRSVISAQLLVLSSLLFPSLNFAQSSTNASEVRETRCLNLRQAKLAATEITTAEVVGAGKFNGPAAAFTGMDLSSFYKTLPELCRVVAHAKPTGDSDIKIEVWLPASGWNGKLQGLGNGGFAGLIDYEQLGAAMGKGYVSTATDAGHTGTPTDATWALGHPEQGGGLRPSWNPRDDAGREV